MAKYKQYAGYRPTLELSMLVKNGATELTRCLSSVAGIADRIIIGDTGSTDDTVSVAKEYGADVISVPWEDDFAQYSIASSPVRPLSSTQH